MSPAAAYAIVRRRRSWPWVLAVAVLLAATGVVYGLATNPVLDWSVTLRYLFAPPILKGVSVTVQLSVYSMLLGTVVGLLVALGRLAGNPVLRAMSSAYILLFRSVPVLLQLLLWGNIGLIARNITLGIPFTDIQFFSIETNDLIVPFTAAVIGLALAEGAYMSEVIRAGVLSVDRGQLEAAASLGMTPSRATRRIVLPQALRVIIPPAGNQFVTLIKSTSLVSVIAGGDLLTQTTNIASTNYRVIEMLVVAAFWYLILVAIASIGQYFIEKYYSKDLAA